MAVVSMAVDTNLTAEVLFDEVAGSYQQVYGNNDGLNRALDRLRDYQGTGASVLDVGCGPGGPAAYMAKSGFKVTGIDVSQVAIDICQRNVPGNFYKADMTDFELNQQFDAIISLYSMFQMSHRSTCSVLFKFASWLRPGGTLVLATIPAEDLLEDKSQLDTSDYVERYQAPFMGRSIAATLITMKGWLGILQRQDSRFNTSSVTALRLKALERMSITCLSPLRGRALSLCMVLIPCRRFDGPLTCLAKTPGNHSPKGSLVTSSMPCLKPSGRTKKFLISVVDMVVSCPSVG